MESMIDDFGIFETAQKQVKYQIIQGKKSKQNTMVPYKATLIVSSLT